MAQASSGAGLGRANVGISFDSDMRIAGYRPSVFKAALRGFMRTGSPGNVVDLKTVFPLRRDGAIVVEECLDRGLLDVETFRVTEDGEAIARAKAGKRTSLARAKTVLGDFLERVAKLNRDPSAINLVEQVWLFGSLMQERETVGDIDLALRIIRRPEVAEDHDLRRRRVAELLTRQADAPINWATPWDREAWVTHRALYGTRRHPLLAGVHDSVEDLSALGTPCRLIYDRERGGRGSRSRSTSSSPIERT